MPRAYPLPAFFAALVLAIAGCGPPEGNDGPSVPVATRPDQVPASPQAERVRQHRLKLQQEVERQRLARLPGGVPSNPRHSSELVRSKDPKGSSVPPVLTDLRAWTAVVPTPHSTPTNVYTGSTVTLSLEDVGIKEAAAMVAEQADIQVEVLGDAASRKVSVVADKQPVGSAIQAIAVSAGAVWWRASDGSYCIATREWCEDAGAALTPSSVP